MSDTTSHDDAGHDDDIDEAHEGKSKDRPELVLARTVWRDQLKERGLDPKNKEVVKEDWKGKKKQYVALSRRILRQLDRQGFALAPKAAESPSA